VEWRVEQGAYSPMQRLRDVVNIVIFLGLIAFIGNSLFHIVMFYVQAQPTP
jgi:hypothetical protein